MKEPIVHTHYRHVVKKDYTFESVRGTECVAAGTTLLDCVQSKEPYDSGTSYLASTGKSYTYVPAEYVKVVKVTKTIIETIEEQDLD